MLFSKFYYYLFFSSLFSFLIFTCMVSFYSFGFDYFKFFNCSNLNHLFSFCSDYISLSFFFMVCTVTFLVLSYSSLYLEHYNNKKFFLLTLFFFFSMIFLVFSGSLLGLSLGWDGLGISSTLLILFYPNKMSIYNSILTMFFNRLGDVFVISLVFYSLMNYSYIFFFDSIDMVLFVFFIFLCSFSKSAQFPLSSWLPAAMSAPTPISAMVHSSTLVTAGIYMVSSFLFYLAFYDLVFLPLYFSVLTFLIGGFLAMLEFDYKKTIAFSTMSQISMILYFLFSSFFFVSYIHMIFHAFFKTLLFVCGGYFFSGLYTSQIHFFFYGRFSNIFVSFLLFSCLYMMSGFYFSSSFFTKDLALEIFLSSFDFFFFLFLILGSCFTVCYCCKLSSVFFFSVANRFLMYDKLFIFFPLVSFFFVVFFSGLNFFLLFFFDFNPMLSSLDLFFMLSPLLISMNFKSFSKMIVSTFFSLDLLFSKFFFFSIYSYFLVNLFPSFFYNDLFFFKSRYLWVHFNFTIFFKSFSTYFFFVLFSLLLFF